MDDFTTKRKREASISQPSASVSDSDSATHKLTSQPHHQHRSTDHDVYGDNLATQTSSTDPNQSQPPWHAAFPAPSMAADLFPRPRLQMMLSMRIASALIIDVRDADYLGGAIRGSLNVPAAPGFWWNRGMLYELAYKSDMEWVIFVDQGEVDGAGMSGDGRAARCAAWFLEHVRATAGDANMHVSVLEGGISGWVRSGPSFIDLMDGFDVGHWQRLFEGR